MSFKKVISVLLIVLLSVTSIFAAESAMSLSIGGGVNTKYKFVAIDDVDAKENLKLVLAGSLEFQGQGRLPLKLSVLATSSEFRFWEDGVKFDLAGTAELRLISLGDLSIYLGGGATSIDADRVDGKTVWGTLSPVASGTVSLKFAEGFKLNAYANLPFNHIKAFVEEKRGNNPDKSGLIPGNVGAYFTLGLI